MTFFEFLVISPCPGDMPLLARWCEPFWGLYASFASFIHRLASYWGLWGAIKSRNGPFSNITTHIFGTFGGCFMFCSDMRWWALFINLLGSPWHDPCHKRAFSSYYSYSLTVLGGGGDPQKIRQQATIFFEKKNSKIIFLDLHNMGYLRMCITCAYCYPHSFIPRGVVSLSRLTGPICACTLYFGKCLFRNFIYIYIYGLFFLKKGLSAFSDF